MSEQQDDKEVVEKVVAAETTEAPEQGAATGGVEAEAGKKKDKKEGKKKDKKKGKKKDQKKDKKKGKKK